MAGSDEVIAQILGNDPGIGSIYKALKVLKESIDGTEGEMRKRASNVDIAQVNVLDDMSESLKRLNESVGWLTAAVICSCADDPQHVLIETNKMTRDPSFINGVMRFID